MAASLFDAMVRHSIYVEGLKRDRTNNLAVRLMQLNTDIKRELGTVSFANMGDMNRTQVLLLIGNLKKLADSTFNAWLNDLIEWLQRYVVIDRELLARIWGATTSIDEPAAEEDDGSKLFGLIGRTAIGANGLLMLPFLTAYKSTASQRIAAAVNMGVVNRQTPADVLAAIVGAPVADRQAKAPDTPAPGQGGGLVGLLNRQGAAVTNTVLQHVSAQTNFNRAKSLFDLYLWISVIDSGTTDICRGRNGEVFEYGKGPLPPAHIGCRSSTMPFDGTGPVTIPTFRMWAKGQPVEFVNDAFDRPPGSEYDGSRSLSLESFRDKFGFITA